jgi:hypothetical protein
LDHRPAKKLFEKVEDAALLGGLNQARSGDDTAEAEDQSRDDRGDNARLRRETRPLPAGVRGPHRSLNPLATIRQDAPPA